MSMDFQGISLNLLRSPPSSSFEGHCQRELRFLPSVTHQQDSHLPSMPALMQHYSAKQGSGCLREQISEPSFHWTLNSCWKLKMGRDLLGHLGFAPLAQSSHDHLHCTEMLDICSSRTRTLLLLPPDIHSEVPTQAETRSGTGSSPEHFSWGRGRDWDSHAVKS